MKKTTFLAFLTISLFNSANAQVLYNETFDNYTLGNLGTDPNGVIPGQGGWLTEGMNTESKNNNLFTITNEPSRGKVLTFSATPPDRHFFKATKTDIDKLVKNRTSGNDVLKFELDYYTGQKSSVTTHSNGTIIVICGNNGSKDISLFHMYFSQNGGILSIMHNYGDSFGSSGVGGFLNYFQKIRTLPHNTWIKVTVYLDYNNKKIYYENSAVKEVAFSDTFLSLSNSSDLIEDFKPTSIYFMMNSTYNIQPNLVHNKFDNIKITALKNVPPEVITLSTNEQLAQKFNLYPNPANNVVNIINNEQMRVKEVEIYDTAGKLITTQNFNDQTQIQLNVSALNSGTYLLHLKTSEGIAVKKLVKN